MQRLARTPTLVLFVSTALVVPSIAHAAHRTRTLDGVRLAGVDLSNLDLGSIDPGPHFPTFRFGLNVGVGPVAGSQPGPVFFASARVGVQGASWFAAYYQNTFAVSENDVTGWWNLYDWNTLMVSLTALDVLEIGVGAGLDYVHQSFRCGVRCVDTTSWPAGMDVRIAAMLPVLGRPRREHEQRRGLSLTFEIHPTFASGGTLTFVMFGIGVDWF